jgi:hypothetical protein
MDGILNPSKYGIFAESEALGELSEMKIESDPQDQGLVKSRACEICSRQLSCYMNWSELYCLQYGIFPHDVGRMMGRPDVFPTRWVYNQKFRCYHPEYRCSCDPRALVIFDMTPSEAKRQFELAAQNGQISQQQQQIIAGIQPVLSNIMNRRTHGAGRRA